MFWLVGTLLVSLLCAGYLFVTVDWFLTSGLGPWIRSWPQTIAVLVLLLTPTTALVGALLLGRRGLGWPSRWVLVLLTVMAVINLGVAVSVVIDGRRPAPEIDRDVEVEIPDALGASG